MTGIPGTILAAKVTTGDTTAPFAVADQDEIKGGWHSGASTAVRDAIPAARLQAGMVFRIPGGAAYEYNGSAWVALPLGGGTTPTGTGFTHITAGAQDAASKLVDTADITNLAVTTAKMSAVGTAGTYGSSTAIPVITTDASGRVTAVSSATPSATITLSGMPSLGFAYQGSTSSVSGNATGGNSFAIDSTREKIIALQFATTTTTKVAIYSPYTFLREVESAVALGVVQATSQVHFDSLNDKIVVSNGGVSPNQAIYCINPTTLAITSTIVNTDLGTRFTQVGGGFIYGIDASLPSKIAKIDLATGTTATLSAALPSAPSRILLDSTNAYLYTIQADTSVRRTTISAMATTVCSVSSGALANVDSASHMLQCPLDGTIWVGRNNGTILVLDGTTLATLATVTITGLTAGLVGFQYNPNRNLVYVMTVNKDAFYIIDAATRVAVNAMGTATSGTARGVSFAFHPATSRVAAFTSSNQTFFWQG